MKSRRLVRAALLGAAAALGLSAAAPAQGIQTIEWIGSKAPSTPDELAAMWTDARVRVTYDDGSRKEFPLGYRTMMTTRTRVGNNVSPAGALYDAHMQPIPDPTVPGAALTSQTPDGSMLVNVAGRLYHLANYEYLWLLGDGTEARDYAPWSYTRPDGKTASQADVLPASVTVTELAQDPATGALTPVAQHPVDFSSVGGLAVACNAYETPWGTFLTSEENYDVDARQVEAERRADPSGRSDILAGIAAQYFGGTTLANPYNRGFLTEVTVGANGQTTVARHYAIGRGTYEMGLVMPDGRTVLAAHDGTNKPLTLFVADKAGDLSAGTLYAAKFDQTGAAHGGSFDMRWVRLGHATDREIRALIDGGIRYSDIFEEAPSKSPGYSEIYVDSDKTPLFVEVKNATAAAFLETMRYASVKGAATEFRKAEGLAFDPDGRTAYLAVTDIDKGMLKGKGSGDAGDQIRVAQVHAGGVYALPVAGGQAGTDGKPIDSDYVPVSAHVPQGLLGVDLAEPDAMHNTASLDHIANPDNLFWSTAYRTLFVGEDSGMHTANFLWAWQPGMSAPVRLLSAPAGAELTGLRVYGDIGGHAYALTNAQHVGDFKPGDNATLKAAMGLIQAKWDQRLAAPLGYLTGLPTVPARTD